MDYGFKLILPNEQDGATKGAMTTFDTPDRWTLGRSRIYAGEEGIYLNSSDTENTFFLADPQLTPHRKFAAMEKMCYAWKSKKFSFPGRVSLAAARVQHDCGGSLRIRLYIDCKCVYETGVPNCKPFTLPGQLAGREVEIELLGTATVYKVEVASSMKELME